MASIEMIQKEFLAEKKFEGLTENSLDSYVNFFKTWNEWLQSEGLSLVKELSPRNSKAFLMWCIEERKNKPKTVNTKLKLLRVFAKWLLEESLIEEDICKGVKAQREDDSPKFLDESDLQAVLKHLRRQRRRENTFTARRNYTLILFLAGTGFRLNELCSLKWRDISFEDDLISIRTSKTRRAQSVPLSDSLRGELLDWRDYSERKLGTVSESVFVTEKGRPLTKDSVQNVFKRLRKSIGIESYFSPHVLRNYYIKNLLKGGLNMREVQLLARHSKIDVTRQYVAYHAYELKEALDEANPLRSLL